MFGLVLFVRGIRAGVYAICCDVTQERNRVIVPGLMLSDWRVGMGDRYIVE